MSSALKDLTLSESFAFSDSIQAVSSRMGKNVNMILEVLCCNFCFDQFDNQVERLWWPYDVVISEQNRGPWRNPARYCHYRHLNHPKWFKLRYPWLRNLWHSTYTTSFLFCMPRKSLQLCEWENDLLSPTFTSILSPSKSRNTCWQTLWPNQPWFVATVCERRLSWRRCLSSCRRGIDDSGGARGQPHLCQRLHQQRVMAIKTSRDNQGAVGATIISSWAKELP